MRPWKSCPIITRWYNTVIYCNNKMVQYSDIITRWYNTVIYCDNKMVQYSTMRTQDCQPRSLLLPRCRLGTKLSSLNYFRMQTHMIKMSQLLKPTLVEFFKSSPAPSPCLPDEFLALSRRLYRLDATSLTAFSNIT